MKELIQLEGDRIVKKISLTKEHYTLGPDVDSDMVFDTLKVPQVYAYLIEDGGTYTIVDPDSSNQVLVNGKQVTRRPLVSGDRINLSQEVSLLYVSKEETDTHFEHVFNRVRDILGQNIVREKELLELKEVTHSIISLDNLGQILNVILDEIEASNQTLRAEIEETETRYRQLVEYLPESIAVHREGIILYVNAAAVELLGAEKPEDLVGTRVVDRVHPDFQKIVAERIRKEKEGHAVPPLDERFLRLDGSAVDVEVVGVPFVYEGKPAAMALFRDISQRKRMEQELLRARKLESVGVLAGGIAHDFNNILQVIRGNALMAKANMDDKENVEFCLTAIEKAVLHAVSLTSQLLTFSRGGTPVTKATSIQELIEESVAFALRGSNVAYTLDFANDLYFVEVDSDQINQVIHNLVLNADQAMPHGGTITISVSNIKATGFRSIHPSLEKGNYVKISIRDQGVGIPENVLQRIFDPYFTTKKEGSGLGLASCYSIVSKHGGIIEAESIEGQGSTFTLYLPASSRQPQKHETGEWSYKIEAKILLMDDDSMVRDTAGRMLQRLGCEVEFAVDGGQAVSQYLRAQELGRPFDIVIFDLTVPGGMGGQDALAELKKYSPSVKAIVASGYSHDPVMAEPQKYGFQGVISKPFDIKTLAKTILQVQGYSF